MSNKIYNLIVDQKSEVAGLLKKMDANPEGDLTHDITTTFFNSQTRILEALNEVADGLDRIEDLLP